MVVIRMQRVGTKKVPHHRIVATEQTRPQRSRVLEVLGYYNPAQQPELVSLNTSRLAYWVSSGAQISTAVSQLVKHQERASRKSGKSS